MSFEEKSAWGSLVGLILVSSWYFPKAMSVATAATSSAPLAKISVIWIVAMIAILVLYHGVIALWGYDTDERDRMIELKAERIAGHVLSGSLLFVVGVVMTKLFESVASDVQPLVLTVWILAAMTFAEGAKFVTQIVYYRIDE